MFLPLTLNYPNCSINHAKIETMNKVSKIRDRYGTKDSTHAETAESEKLTWRQPAFWRNAFLYYWFFALFGFILEVVWRQVTNNQYYDPFDIPTIAPLAVPYGLGAVALILIVWPLCQRFKKMNILLIFVLATLVTTAVEYLCSVIIVAFMGSNPFWDYSSFPFNFQGHICLHNAVLLGIVSTIFLRVIFPRIEQRVAKTSSKLLNDLFLLLFVTYLADVLLVFIMWLVNQ